MSTLGYFDMFDYPLTQLEIFQFLEHQCSYEDYLKDLQYLVNQGIVFKIENYFSLQKDYSLIDRRKKGNQNAKKLLTSAEKVASIIYHFPFVRGVAVSGSLSKNYADDRSDIDLFIITAPNRLWIARTFLHLFKKFTYLLNWQNYFCMNYFVDESMLMIEEKNLYTATEIVTLIPMKGIEVFKSFYSENDWTRAYLPNHSMKVSHFKHRTNPVLKRAVEFLLDRLPSGQLDLWLMKITRQRWDRKSREGRKNSKGILMGMNASRHCAKPDPANFQIWLLQQHQQKISTMFSQVSGHLKAVY